MKTEKRNKLIRELLSGNSDEDIKHFVTIRKSIRKNGLANRLDKIRERVELKIRKPVPTPRKAVKQYEDNIIPPPVEFRDDYEAIPASRTKKGRTNST